MIVLGHFLNHNIIDWTCDLILRLSHFSFLGSSSSWSPLQNLTAFLWSSLQIKQYSMASLRKYIHYACDAIDRQTDSWGGSVELLNKPQSTTGLFLLYMYISMQNAATFSLAQSMNLALLDDTWCWLGLCSIRNLCIVLWARRVLAS